ncbi:uncharacterized protein ISCGN_027438 [Ixodes scapularis]
MATSTEPPSEVNGRNSESAVMTYQVPQFDETKDKWTSYIIRIESYFEGNGIMDDVKKRALLVSALGSRAIDILSGRCAPRKVKELTYSQAIEILEEFYAPRPNEIAESFKFFTRVQKEEESAQQFIVELRQLADKCNFGDMLDRMLRDKIVCGIRNIDVQKALLSRPKLTLQETENIVLAAEAARQGVKLMKPSDVKSEPELHKLAAPPPVPWIFPTLDTGEADCQTGTYDRLGGQRNQARHVADYAWIALDRCTGIYVLTQSWMVFATEDGLLLLL